MFQLCLVALARECECLHSCVPLHIHILLKVSTSAFDESVNLSKRIFDPEHSRHATLSHIQPFLKSLAKLF